MTEEAGTVQAALSECDYRRVESPFSSDKTPLSVPCQLRFPGDVKQDTDRFHGALDEQGFCPVDHNPANAPADPYYNGEVVNKETYARTKILVFRGDVVRIYPREDGLSESELEGLLKAIAKGFDSELEHDPIKHDE